MNKNKPAANTKHSDDEDDDAVNMSNSSSQIIVKHKAAPFVDNKRGGEHFDS
jgi:hypothetical protein